MEAEAAPSGASVVVMRHQRKAGDRLVTGSAFHWLGLCWYRACCFFALPPVMEAEAVPSGTSVGVGGHQ